MDIYSYSEIYNFTKVWLTVFISLSYCYDIGKITPKGPVRFICFPPILCLFLFLLLKLSSLHLRGITSFFIAWLANFKLLLLAFGKSPLASPASLFPSFHCRRLFPHQNPTLQWRKPVAENSKSHKSPLNYSVKLLLLAAFIRVYDYSNFLHPKLLSFLYCFRIYVFLELTLAVFAALIRAFLDLELEPQFDDPYLSTSLQDFWGRRWNVTVSRILRPTVYEPVLHFSSRVVGRRWAPLPAVFSTFVVSAVTHELIFGYLGHLRPTLEITWFFLFHGACLVVEIALKKSLTVKWRLPRVLKIFLTVGFVIETAFRWFFPPLLRCNGDVRAFEEYAEVGVGF
ncbi:Acyl-CoA--sterol O-acyltransferase 1-like protein [Melia azedarach]|uniref:Acyl-CoA--sterol O-acyltransferase 1-like protein n=1 Tax=Melia azedarach TaxID=155640 RepID=A0ACC1X001_MELAZ|nr:Acyl-CoA--sterol O-acyltransferase 1-like protein [Melia azedarach]